MKHILRAISVATIAAGVMASAWAQPRGGMGGGSGMSASMAKFFGNNKTWSAKTISTVNGPSGPMSMEMDMAMLDGKMCVKMDMTKAKAGSMPPGAIAQMKQMGMDKSINITRPDLKVSYMVFPGLHAYAAMPMTDKQVADARDESKIERTSLGKETIDGHPCAKEKLIVTSPDNEKHQVIVWNATDLKDFPIQMQMEEQGTTMTMKYSDIKFEKPDAKMFEAPADYTKYDSAQALMQAEVMKKGGFGAPPPR
jgi:hypothetical protein